MEHGTRNLDDTIQSTDLIIEMNQDTPDDIAESENAIVPALPEQDENEEIQKHDTTIPSTSPCNETHVTLNDLKNDLVPIANGIKDITGINSKIADEIHKIHKLYHNEFVTRLQSMQEELERYREIEKGRAFDDILKEIAKLYSDNLAVLDKISDEKTYKQIDYMFRDVLQLLENYSVLKLESKPGDKRNTKHCQVIERIVTNNLDLHDTVAKSLNVGFYLENRSLLKEMIHVYIFSETVSTKKDNALNNE